MPLTVFSQKVITISCNERFIKKEIGLEHPKGIYRDSTSKNENTIVIDILNKKIVVDSATFVLSYFIDNGSALSTFVYEDEDKKLSILILKRQDKTVELFSSQKRDMVIYRIRAIITQ